MYKTQVEVVARMLSKEVKESLLPFLIEELQSLHCGHRLLVSNADSSAS